MSPLYVMTCRKNDCQAVSALHVAYNAMCYTAILQVYQYGTRFTYLFTYLLAYLPTYLLGNQQDEETKSLNDVVNKKVISTK